MRVVAALALRDLRITFTHPGAFLVDAVGLVAGSSVFFYLGHSFGDKRAFFAFAMAGLMVVRIHAAVPRALENVRGEIASGTFELLAGSRASTSLVALGLVAFELLRGAWLAVLLLIIGVVLFGAPAPHHIGGVAGVACGLAFGVAVFAGLAFLVLGILMVMRQAGALGTLSSIVMPLLAAAYFPIKILPQPLEAIATLLPFHGVVELIREGLLRDRVDGGTLAVITLQTALLVALGLFVFSRGVEHALRKGSLSTE